MTPAAVAEPTERGETELMLTSIARQLAAALSFSMSAMLMISACEDPTPPPCLEAGESCGTEPGECCSGACITGKCPLGGCAALGAVCGADMPCCNGVACMAERCGGQCAGKARVGEACKSASDC